MARSLNRVQLIGNLTRDPELRYTPSGTAVVSYGLATNRSWTTDTGEKREETEFHRIVAWNKLAELCSQLLTKGRKVYVEGRIANRKYTKQDGTEQFITEIIIDDMIILDSRKVEAAAPVYDEGARVTEERKPVEVKKPEPKERKEVEESQPEETSVRPDVAKAKSGKQEEITGEEIADDIPF